MASLTSALFEPVRLWNHSPDRERRASWLELFFDLIFVAALAQLGATLVSEYSLRGVLEYVFRFALIWWAWYGHTMYSTRFDSSDGAQRFLTVMQVFTAAVMAANAKGTLDGRDSAGFTAAYAGMRAILFIQYLRAWRIAQTTPLVRRNMLIIGTACLFWISAALAPVPFRYFLWAVAFAIDLLEPGLSARTMSENPPDPHHLPERFGLFTIILLGEFVAAIMRGMERQESWPPSAALSAFVSLGIGFAVWWWYFHVIDAARARHIRSSDDVKRFHKWTIAHFTLYVSIVTIGVGLEHVIALAPGSVLSIQQSSTFLGASLLLIVSMIVIESATGDRGYSRWKLIGRMFVVVGMLSPVILHMQVPTYVLPPFVAVLIAICVRTSRFGMEPKCVLGMIGAPEHDKSICAQSN